MRFHCHFNHLDMQQKLLCHYDYKHYMFDEQVDVGDFLRFKSCVLYTEHENPDQPLINVEVVAHVTRPELRSSEVSPLILHLLKIKHV